MTKREEILAAVKNALVNITGVANDSVYRSRVSALSRREFPAIVIEPLNDTPDLVNNYRLQWTLTFQAVVYVRADDPDTSADGILEQIHSKIVNDPTLNGFANVVDIQAAAVDWAFHEADKPLAVIGMQFRAIYQTNALDISQ